MPVLAILLAACGLTVPAVSAQNAAQQGGCSAGGALDFEIGFIRGPLQYLDQISVKDVAADTTHTYTLGAAIHGTGGCHWVAHLFDFPRTHPNEARLTSNKLYRISFLHNGSVQSGYDYFYCSDAPGPGAPAMPNGSVYCPYGTVGQYPDYLLYEAGNGVRVLPTQFISGGITTNDDIQDYLPGYDWVLPLDYWKACEAVGNCPSTLGNIQNVVFLTRQSSPPYVVSNLRSQASAPPFSFAPNWMFDAANVSRLEFDAGQNLTIGNGGSLTASGVTFTASGSSWRGVRVQGARTTFDGITVEKVSGASGAGASTTYLDSEPNIKNSLIRNSVGPGVDGIYLGGAAQIGLVDNVTISGMSGNGIEAQAELDYVRFINNTVRDNDGHGFLFGYKSAGFLGQNTAELNDGQGIYAHYGDAYLAGTYGGSVGDNVVYKNQAGGVLARSGSIVRGGTSSQYKNNTFRENGLPGSQWFDPPGNAKEGPDAWSRDAGTVAYLRNGWWGRPANPDTTSCAAIPCSGGYTGTLFVDPMLASAPSAVFKGGPEASSSTGDGSTAARAALLSASDAAENGQRAQALGLWRDVIAASPRSNGAAVAISEIGRLITDERREGGESVRTDALAFLSVWATEGSPQRARALATLARARASTGDLAGALAAADALAAMDDAQASLEGRVARFHLLLSSARQRPSVYAQAASALHALERAAPASDEALWARRALTIEAGAEIAGAIPRGDTAEPLAKAGDTGVASDEASLSVWPNPSAGAATVGLTLTDDAEVSVTVYDARGREVAVLHEGPLTAGGHRIELPAALAPGAYLVRARLGDAILSRTLTVLR